MWYRVPESSLSQYLGLLCREPHVVLQLRPCKAASLSRHLKSYGVYRSRSVVKSCYRFHEKLSLTKSGYGED
jgi:hypothetical protein